MRVYIRKKASYTDPVRYILKIIEKNRKVSFTFLDSPEDAQIVWDHELENTENINLAFYNALSDDSNRFDHETQFPKSIIIADKANKEDSIATIFYLINCLQEISPKEHDLDQFGRFKYTSSYQSKYGNIEENLVEHLIDNFCNIHSIKGEKSPSKFFISHDIDTIYGSFFQDGFWALKNMKLGVVMNLIFLELMRRPHWKNMDRIIKINDEYDVKSTFFWLVNQGKGTQGIKNADYSIAREKKLLKLVENSGNTNGLHKSCSFMSIEEELAKGGLNTTYNRYHFLNFLPHRDWSKISESKLDFDASLGFAEHFGFRNSYGKAFQPFDFKNNRPYDFVEAPLNFMDGTFHKYMKLPTKKIGSTIIDFYEKNPRNCDFSLLWHNTYFTSYKYNSFIDEYKKVLSFILENKIECVNPLTLIEENRLEW